MSSIQVMSYLYTMTFDLYYTGAVYLYWPATESGALWRHATTSWRLQPAARRHSDVAITWRRHDVTGVIVTSLLRVNAYDVAMTFLRDVYVNLAGRGQYTVTCW